MYEVGKQEKEVVSHYSFSSFFKSDFFLLSPRILVSHSSAASVS